MHVLTSTPSAAGHLVLIRLPEGAALILQDTDGSRTDLTGWAADLLRIGMEDAAEARRGEQLAPDEVVEVARVALEGDVLTAPATFTYLHLPSGDWADMTPETAVQLISGGVRVQVTAGIAREAVERDGMPDDPRTAELPDGP